MKRILKYFVILSLVLIVVIENIPFYVKAEDNNVPKKGDLRCPEGSESKCQETENGVILTEQNGDYIVKKIVEKTDVLGELKVKFEVGGDDSNKTKVSKDAYVVVLFDVSSSISGKFTNAKNAIIKFSKIFESEEYKNQLNGASVKFALVQFAGRLSNRLVETFTSNLENTYFCEYDSCYMSSYSRVELGLYEANKLLSDKADANKYVVLFGDGRYWDPNDTCWNNCNKVNTYGIHPDVNVVSEHRKLNNIGATIYTVRYPTSWEDNPKNPNEKPNNIKSMKYISNNIDGNYYFADGNNYDSLFSSIAEKILTNQIATGEAISAKLVDTVGSKFETSSTTEFVIKNFGSDKMWYSPEFIIKIDNENIKYPDWYKTNQSFKLELGDNLVISSLNEVQPEMYWEPEPRELLACSSEAYIKLDDVENLDFYTKKCSQGKKSNGFYVNLSINNLEFMSNNFNLQNGYGFPSNISLSNDIECTYEFKTSSFNETYQSLNQRIANAGSDERERNSVNNLLEGMNKVLSYYKSLVSYSNNINRDLNDYIDTFSKLSPVLTVTYKPSYETKNINYINVGEVLEDSNCTNQYGNVNGENIIVSQTCNLNVSKEMTLEKTCINIRTGEPVECNDNNNYLLNGGYKFYPDMKEGGGFISLKIEKADYFGNSVLLDGSKKNEDGNYQCEFKIYDSNEDIYYRVIDVSDPFLQKYKDDKRDIGINWKNNNYNFVNIIKSDVWSNNPEYVFKLSKENVENIKKSTVDSGERVTSYTGVDCFVTPNNNYECDFLKNKKTGTGSYGNYFSEYKDNTSSEGLR